MLGKEQEGKLYTGWITGFSALAKRRLRFNLIALQVPEGGGMGQGGAELFSLVSRGKISLKILAVLQRRSRLDIRKHFLTKRVLQHWNVLPREVVDAPVFERQLDHALDKML